MTYRVSFAAACLLTLTACGDDASTPDTGDADPSDVADGSGDASDDTSDADDNNVDASDATNTEAARAAILAVDEAARLTLPGLSGEVQVLRTEGNIPHIYAETELDAYRAAGFIMARDRYFEFELARRLAQGRLSELLGDLGLENDLDSRGQGMAYVVGRISANLDDESAAIFDAYAAGINTYIDAVKAGTLPAPSELALVGPLLGVADPTTVLEPVNRLDVAGFAAFVVYQSSYSEDDVTFQRVAEDVAAYDAGELPEAELREAGLRDDIWAPPQGVWPTTSVAGFGLNAGASNKAAPARSAAARVTRGAPVAGDVLRRISEHQAWWNPHVFRRIEDDWGSNVWAVSGANTADGASLLAGDGHLSLGIPTLFYQMSLNNNVFGNGDLHEMGLYLPGFPFLGVGTNGRIAWSQTYPTTDVIDWYAEQIQLDASGEPEAALFNNEWVPLVRVDEEYTVSGTLGSETTTVVWPRWETADGRWIQSIEGLEVEPDDVMLAPGQALVQMRGDWIVPGDQDSDGIVSALSMDYAAFDIGDMGGAVRRLGASNDVAEFRNHTNRFIGYAQNLIAADADGGITYSFFSAIPCRQYLERNGDAWADGSDPNQVLDGNRYGGFTIPINGDGIPETVGGDPYRCVVPFDEWPSALNPASGYLMNANNDPAGLTLDGALGNDQWHIGGPWSLGFRAKRIDEVLAAEVAAGTATLASMQALQGDHTSMVGARIATHLLAAIVAGRGWAGGDAVDWAARAGDIYTANAAQFAEVETRLQAWIDRGNIAASGVQTFYSTPEQDERDDAVATMIFNAWFRELRQLALDDETWNGITGLMGTQTSVRTLVWMLDGRGSENPLSLASWNETTEESVFFDDVTTVQTERSPEIILQALQQALDTLETEPTRAGTGGFGTSDMSAWLWGLRHQVRFESILVGFAAGNPLIDVLAADFSITTDRLPLAASLANDDPRRPLKWFPRPGDLYSVDAARPGLGGDYTYAQGPVMRMVIALHADGRVEGANILPGGQSGLTDSPHFDDQAAVWLGNETWPLHFDPNDVAGAALSREVLVP